MGYGIWDTGYGIRDMIWDVRYGIWGYAREMGGSAGRENAGQVLGIGFWVLVGLESGQECELRIANRK